MIGVLGSWALAAFLLLLALATIEFVAHAADLGWAGLTGRATWSRIWSETASANWGIFIHMITGAVITVLAPLQTLPVIRRRVPVLHRWSGRLFVVLAFLTGIGGLVYILLNGTVGGLHMSVAFAIYGLLVVLCAVQTIRFARARQVGKHQEWALRMFFLAIGSWLYRVHYAIWGPATGNEGMNNSFTGWFDQVNLWAFFVPYLVILEAVFAMQGRGLLRRRAQS